MFFRILNKLRYLYLKVFRPRFAEDIHTEYYFDDLVWNKILKYPRRDKVIWYVVTPANYEYLKNCLGTQLEKDSISQIMSDRLRYMKNNKFKLGLHVHFWQNKDMPRALKEKIIKEAIDWGKENGVVFKELIPGWTRVDNDLLDICKSYNLKLKDSTKFTHDFEL